MEWEWNHTLAGGMGIGMTVKRTLTHHNFLTDPVKAAEEVWEQSGLVSPSLPFSLLILCDIGNILLLMVLS